MDFLTGSACRRRDWRFFGGVRFRIVFFGGEIGAVWRIFYFYEVLLELVRGSFLKTLILSISCACYDCDYCLADLEVWRGLAGCFNDFVEEIVRNSCARAAIQWMIRF